MRRAKRNNTPTGSFRGASGHNASNRRSLVPHLRQLAVPNGASPILSVLCPQSSVRCKRPGMWVERALARHMLPQSSERRLPSEKGANEMAMTTNSRNVFAAVMLLALALFVLDASVCALEAPSPGGCCGENHCSACSESGHLLCTGTAAQPTVAFTAITTWSPPTAFWRRSQPTSRDMERIYVGSTPQRPARDLHTVLAFYATLLL